MAIKWICCLFALTFLGSAAKAQLYTHVESENTHNPQPQTPAKQSQDTQIKNLPDTEDRSSTCVVEQQYKIQCGAPGTSAAVCKTLNCCYDGTICYYGKYGKCLWIVLLDAYTVGC